MGGSCTYVPGAQFVDICFVCIGKVVIETVMHINCSTVSSTQRTDAPLLTLR
jgi:hypothetical protein